MLTTPKVQPLKPRPFLSVSASTTRSRSPAGSRRHLYESQRPLDSQTTRFTIGAPDGWRLAVSGGLQLPIPFAVSPDGRKILFLARSADHDAQLWVRSLDTLEPVPLQGTDGASAPFWSPDSSALAFFADGKLKKVGLTGGPVLTLCDAGSNGNGAWSGDVILFASRESPIRRVPSSGGTPADATVLGQSELGHTRPVFLPDGRHFLYHVLGASGSRLGAPEMLASLDSRSATKLLDTGSTNVAYSDGYLLFMRDHGARRPTVRRQEAHARGRRISRRG